MHIKNYEQIDLKNLIRIIDLVIPAQEAKLSPPVGPMLGQVKIKIKDFCNLFNEVTKEYPLELPLRVLVYIYKKELFDFSIKTPAVSYLLKCSLNFNENSKNYLTLLDIYKIALIKREDLDFLSLDLLFKNVLLTAKLMNIEIKN